MPVRCAAITAFIRSSFCAALSVAEMFSDKFGRENPLTRSKGSRSASTWLMSSLTTGVAVAVSATHCGRPIFASDFPNRK